MQREWLSMDRKHRLGVSRTGASVLASMFVPRLQSPAHVTSDVKGLYSLQNFKSVSPSGLVNC